MLFFNPTNLVAFTTLLSVAHAIPITPPPSPLAKRAIGATIRPTYSDTTCLGVTSLSNGVILTTGACTLGTGFYNQWDISPGDNPVVRLGGLPAGSGDWCLDAGLDFTSGATGGNPSSQTWKIVETTTTPPPTGQGRTIRPTFNDNTCLGVTTLANGASLSSGSCAAGSGFYNRWDIVPGDNQVVRLGGLDWCLDAGLDYTSGTIIGLKIWQCYPGVPQQR
ncbi:hypothetical protein QFC22_006123 [Naganishia vaughanmartiniae]|uniref:Uncharacterized protein n=1 Tax=Naganishia vaughanmartiniae TaxID=1424756 RepID=A0ACC2WR58_9TREE|nr:hypothetical protein QFC22_006123 [Naganishia vaughanmartiniae]